MISPAQIPVPNGADTAEAIERVLEVLLRHRRAPRDEPQPDPSAFDPQRRQIAVNVAAGRPLTLVLPGFPCKSPNPAKVLGHLPDLGERLALRYLEEVRAAIAKVYEPGARVLICSDGHVFADLIGVPDEHVDEYGEGIRALLRTEELDDFETVNLTHIYPDRSHDERRALLDKHWAPTREEIRARCQADPAERALYLGITRFLFEDAGDHRGSRASLQRRSRERAYGVVARSNAWAALLADRLPDTVRLSIHPHRAGTAKLGIRLLAAADPWTTPWHSCAVRRPDGSWTLDRADRARRLGQVVYRDGRPDHILAA